MVSSSGLFAAIAILSGSCFPLDGEQDRKLEIAFGKDCAELRSPFRLWFPERKIVVAAGDIVFEKNNNVRATSCSIAIFDPKNDRRIMTRIQCDYIVLILDRPVTRIEDLGRRKIVEVEVAGFPKLVVPK